MKVLSGLACVAAVGLTSQVVRADVVNDWNEQWLDTIRAVGGPPCPLARNGAIVFAAIYEAVNSIDQTHEPYIASLPVQRPALKQAAVVGAAHKALVTLYPARQAIYDAQFDADLALLGNSPAVLHGVAVGEAAADQIIAARANDGTATEPPYVYLDVPGSYKPTTPDFTSPPFNPGWGSTLPWTMAEGDHFRPNGPLGFRRLDKLLPSAGYARQLNEVKRLGKRVSSHRTADQTEIAWFWANDRNGTFKPPGHLLYITQVVADDQGLSLVEKVRLLALVAIGMGDAGLVAWDMKYSTNIDLWRPVSGIREADTDNNPATTADPAWEPLLDFTPPFPAYTSGHATFGAVHAAILKNFFGRDDITFTVGTDEPIVSSVTRTFHSFTEAARENGLSRVYLGVHYRFDVDIGFATGTILGNHVFNTILRPITCAGDFNADGRIDGRDVFVFTQAYFAGQDKADLNDDNAVNSTDYYLFVDYYFQGCQPVVAQP